MEFSANQGQTAIDALLEIANDSSADLKKYQDLNFQRNLDDKLDSSHPVFNSVIKTVREDKIHKLTNFFLNRNFRYL